MPIKNFHRDARSLVFSDQTNLLEQAAYHYELQERETPNLYRSLFDYDSIPKISFNHRNVPSTADTCKANQRLLESTPSLPRLHDGPQWDEETGLDHWFSNSVSRAPKRLYTDQGSGTKWEETPVAPQWLHLLWTLQKCPYKDSTVLKKSIKKIFTLIVQILWSNLATHFSLSLHF